MHNSKASDQNESENKFQVIYVNEKYDQCENASESSSTFVCDDLSLSIRKKKVSSFKFSFIY